MVIRSSTELRNDFNTLSALAHETGEPVYITKNGDGDLAVMSIEAFEGYRRDLEQRATVLEAEARRFAGEPAYGVGEVRAMLKERYANARTEDSPVGLGGCSYGISRAPRASE